MRRFRLTDRLAATRHISDEDLLAHLDGELSARGAAHVRGHLQSCWECRSRAEKMGRAISELVDARNVFHAATPPPGGWRGFDARLSAAAREEAAKLPAWRSFSVPVLPIGVAAAAAMLALVVWLARSPIVSAQEILTRAGSAELSEIQATSEPVIYQKIEVRRKVHGRLQSAQIESWTDWRRQRVARRGDAETWRDLDEVLRENRMASRPLLSPAAYMSWRDGLKSKKEQVVRERLQNGAEVLSITTSVDGAAAPGSIREARLVVRATDWHPVRQSVRLGPDADEGEFELAELAFDVRPLAALDESLFGAAPRPAPAPVVPPRPAPAPVAVFVGPPPPDPDEVMARSLLALHTAGACLREQIEVTRDGAAALSARGVAESADRKAELTRILLEAGVAQVQIDTTEDALRSLASGTQPASLESVAPAEAFKSGKPPVADRWKDVLDSTEMTRLSNTAVTLSEEWLAHAAALGRVNRQFPTERRAKLSARSAALLGEVVRDHTDAIRKAIGRFREALAPLPVADVASAPEEGPAERADLDRLEGEAADARRLTLQLFAGSGAAQEDVDEMLGRLLNALGSMHARSQRLAVSASTIFGSDGESAEADSRRIP